MMDLDRKPIILKVNVNGIPMGSIGYIKDFNHELYEIYIPKYQESVFIMREDFNNGTNWKNWLVRIW